MYFKPVVYCDQERQAHVLHSISAPRSVSELLHYINEQLHFHVHVLSYWNYTHRQYELLTSIDALIQPEALLMRRDEESRNHTNQTSASKASLEESSLLSSTLPHNMSSSISGNNNSSNSIATYRAQLWAESSFVQLEPIAHSTSNNSNSSNNASLTLQDREFQELAQHIRSFAGNGFITYKLLHAARIRYTYLARMFNETRKTLTQRQNNNGSTNDNSAGVEMMMFYTSNAWSLPQVISHGFCLSKSATQCNDASENVIDYKEIEASVVQFIESFMRNSIGDWNKENTAHGILDALTYDYSWKVCKNDNTETHPFVFATSLRSPHERVPPFSAIRHVQLVLLCEVVCGKEYELPHMLDSPDVEQHELFQTSCDSLAYYAYKNKRKSFIRKVKTKNRDDNDDDEDDDDNNNASRRSNSFFRSSSRKKRRSVSENSNHREASASHADESTSNEHSSSRNKEARKDADDNVLYKQVQVQHSYQALPRYLLLLQPMIRGKSIHTSHSHLEELELEEWKEQTMTLSAMRANSSSRQATQHHRRCIRRSKSREENKSNTENDENKTDVPMHRRPVMDRSSRRNINTNNNIRRAAHSAERPRKQFTQQQQQEQQQQQQKHEYVRSHSYSAKDHEYMQRSFTLPRASSTSQVNTPNLKYKNSNKGEKAKEEEENEEEDDDKSSSFQYRWHRSLLRRSHSAPHDDMLQSNKTSTNNAKRKENNISRANPFTFNKTSSTLSLLEPQPILPPFNRVVEQIHARQEHEQQILHQQQELEEEQELHHREQREKEKQRPVETSKSVATSARVSQTLRQRPPLLPTSTSTLSFAPGALKKTNSSVDVNEMKRRGGASKPTKSVTIQEQHINKTEEADLPAVLNKSTTTLTLPSTTNSNNNSSNIIKNESSANYTVSQLSLIPVEFQCTTHPKRTTSLFCKTCHVLVCPYCASVGHHKTHDTQLIQDKAKEVANEVQTLCQTLHNSVAMYAQWEANWRNTQSEVHQQHTQRLKTLQMRVNEIKHKLDTRYGQLQQQLTEYVHQVKSTPTANVAKAQHACASALHSLEAAINNYQIGRQSSGDVQSASRNARIATLTFVHNTPELIARAEEALNTYMERERTAQGASSLKPLQLKSTKPESLNEMARAMQVATESKAMSDVIIQQCDISTLVHDIEQWGSSVHDTSLTRDNDHAYNKEEKSTLQEDNKIANEEHELQENLSINHSTREKRANESVTVVDDQLVQSMHDIERCLFDLQRGHIWVIEHASYFFAPGQDKTISSTPFRLLGMNWELRITPVFYSAQQMATSGGAVVVTAAASSEVDKINQNEGDSSNDKEVKAHVHTDNAPHLSLSTFSSNNINTNTKITMTSANGHDEWLGLFLCPCEHTLRMDYRVIAFSDVVWKEWKVTGWSGEFVGKGWGLHPFLQRKELMRVDKLAREDRVKICIAPISGLY